MYLLKRILRLSIIVSIVMVLFISITTNCKYIVTTKDEINTCRKNGTQDFINKFANEINLNKLEDDFGGIIFTGDLENTSDLYFKKLTFKLEYKDECGNIIYDDYLSVKNFSPGMKKKIKLRPYENKIVNVDLVTDWYEVE